MTEHIYPTTDREIAVGYLRASEPDASSTSFPWLPGPLLDAFLEELVSNDDVTDVWYRVRSKTWHTAPGESPAREFSGWSHIVCVIKGDPTRPVES